MGESESERQSKVQGMVFESHEPEALLRTAMARVAEYRATGQLPRVIVLAWPLGDEPAFSRSTMFTSEVVMAAARLRLEADDLIRGLYPNEVRPE